MIMEFVKDGLLAHESGSNGTTDFLRQEPGYLYDNIRTNQIHACLRLHAPPQMRTYAPDGRYVMKQAAVWLDSRTPSHTYEMRWGQEGNNPGVSRAFRGVREWRVPTTLPIHQYGERQLSIASVGTPWHIKAIGYTVLVRNGKTPSGWT